MIRSFSTGRPHLILGALLSLGSLTHAQTMANQVFGPWDNVVEAGNPPSTVQVYVDSQTTIAPANQNGTVCQPYSTISQALTNHVYSAPTLTDRVSINVAPGKYAETITMPAHGVALEPWSHSGTLFSSRVRLVPPVSPTSTYLITVDTEGNEDLPGSVIKGIEFDGFHDETLKPISGIIITAPAEDGAGGVQVTQCSFRNLVVGVHMGETSSSSYPVRHLIYNNAFSWPEAENEESSGVIGIQLFPGEQWSTLVRSNRITNYDLGISVIAASPAANETRILSNSIQRASHGIIVQGGNLTITNNTIAFCSTYGVLLASSLVDLFNNILWNPGSSADLSLISGAILNGDGFNLYETAPQGVIDTFPGSKPFFVGGDAMGSVLPPQDLHLLPTSPMINAGANTRVATFAPDPNAPVLLGIQQVSRVDVNMDMDEDPRLIGAVDVGADETTVIAESGAPTTIRLSDTVGGAAQRWDRLGNVYADPTGNYSVTIDVEGPASAVGFIVTGFIYSDSIGLVGAVPPAITEVEGSDIFRNRVTPSGNELFTNTLGWFALSPLIALTPQGTGSITLPLNTFDIYGTQPESELVVQLLYTTPGGGTRLSNRLVLDLNSACNN